MGLKTGILSLAGGLIVGGASILTPAIVSEDFRTTTGINAQDKAIIQEQDQTIKDTREEMQAIELARQTLLTEKTTLQNKVTTLTNSKTQLENQIAELTTEKTELSNRIEDYLVRINGLNNDLEFASFRIDELNNLLRHEKNNYEEIQTELANVQSQLSIVSSSLSEKESLLEQARSELATKTTELEQANARIEELENSASENSEYYCTASFNNCSIRINGTNIYGGMMPALEVSVADVILPVMNYMVSEYMVVENFDFVIYNKFNERVTGFPNFSSYSAGGAVSTITFVDKNGNELTPADVSSYETFTAYVCEYSLTWHENAGCYRLDATIQLTDGVLKTSGGADVDWGNE